LRRALERSVATIWLADDVIELIVQEARNSQQNQPDFPR
jgi:hypothetical protein